MRIPVNQQDSAQAPAGASRPRVRGRWYHVLGSLLFSIFCLTVGLVLAYLPWDLSWKTNYFSSISFTTARGAELANWWRDLWLSPYFRGAITGLGLLNIYIGFREAGRMLLSSPDSDVG